MRHLHHRDVDFLETFDDQTVGLPSPATAIAVLSRADEIGGGKRDALESASAIAARYAADDRVRRLCVTVTPVAGLLAETAATLREDEFAALRALAAMPGGELADAVLSADRFCDPAFSPLPSATRRDLVLRLGMYGVRFALDAVSEEPGLSAPALAGLLRSESGIETLVDLIDTHFAPRARVLKDRTALQAIQQLVEEVTVVDPGAAESLRAELERAWTASDFLELRLWQLIDSGVVELDDDERAEVRRVWCPGSVTARLGLDPDASPADQLERATDCIRKWREREAYPLTERAAAEAYGAIAVGYERAHRDVGSTSRNTRT